MRGLCRTAPHVRTLLVVPPGVPADGAIETVVDRAGTVLATFGAGPHLVRPDGYLAARGVEGVQAYLRQVHGVASAVAG